MKKTAVVSWLPPGRSLKKLFIFMKLSAMFFFVVCMQASASVYSQHTISVKLTKANLEKAFTQIEDQSGFRFVYNDDNLPLWHRVSIDVKDLPINEVLTTMLANTNLGFRMMPNNLIVIAPMATVKKDITVKGRIVNPAGEPLQMVSVRLKNSTIGVLTNEKGEFELNVPEEGMLILSYVGFASQEIPVNASMMNIVLQPNSNSMEEVVVVGYGVQRKISTTGAVDQIAGKQLAERPIANIFQGLQGASPGLNINYSGGRPGSTPTINIRGVGSIVANASAVTTPLIIIDGIPSTTEDFFRINANDVNTVTVLRDAASAAIYGARASFGVILITTKTGTTGGRQKISYNNYFAWSKPTVLPDQITDPYIFSRVLETSTNNTPWDYVNYSDYQYQWAKERSDDPSVEDTRTDPNDPTKWIYMGSNNWNDFFFNKSSMSASHSVSLSGSGESGKGRPFGYLLSGDYTKENGLNRLAKDEWNRYGLRGRMNFSPMSWLKVDNNLNIYQTQTDAPAYKITDLYYLMPTQVAINPDGTWANTAAGRLGAQLTNGGRDVQTRFGFQDVVRGVASFLNDDLQVTANASFKREMWKYNTDNRKYSIGYGPTDIREEGGNGLVSVRNGVLKQDVYDLYANYTKRLGDHEIRLLAGYNQEKYEWSYEDAARTVLISSSLPYLGLTTGTPTVGASYSAYSLRGVFGRLNYSYKNKYIIEGNGRIDETSRFLAKKRRGFFPSVSGAWIATEEPFMQDITRVLSTLKFRISYGSLGNQVTENFRAIPSLPVGNSGYIIDGQKPTIITSSPLLPVDPETYTWEKVKTFNLGGDFGLLKDRLLVGVDVYDRRTIGMLTDAMKLPSVLGVAPPPTNAANLSTKGWELSVNYRDEFNAGGKPLHFGAKFILSDSRTKITKYDKNALGLLSDYRVGQYTGEIWGLVNDGYFKTKEEIDALDETVLIPWGALDIVPGWPKYVDQNGDKKITKGNGTTKDPGDYQVIGNNSSRYRYGINLDASWNNFDLSVFMQGVAKRDFYPRHYLFWGPYQQPYAGIYPWNLDFYRGASETGADRDRHSQAYINAGLADANTDSYFPVLQSWLADANYGSGLDIPQSKYLLNGAYLRVKNVTIGYTLPTQLTKRFKVSRLRVFATGENLYEFSSIKKYFDPEAIEDGYGWAYPFSRKYAFGVNLDF